MAIGASRLELLEWINTTYDLNYTKIEQCGNGAIYCQIFDSVFGDLPMSKVNFNPTSEYQSLNNYKILQSGFSKHKITREVPVEKLLKCRLQDNLEFLQWMSRLWSENKLDEYDPNSRRKSSVPSSSGRRVLSNSSTPSANASTSRRSSLAPSAGSTISVQKQRETKPLTTSSVRPTSRTPSTGKITRPSQTVSMLQDDLKGAKAEIGELKLVQESLEAERNFYFNKLRDIEILCQNLSEKLQLNEEVEVGLPEVLSHVQEILYSTTEGFQIPEDDQVGGNKENDVKMIDEETF